jgi:hypothetical protein
MSTAAENRVDFDEALWRERVLLALQSISVSLDKLAEVASQSVLPVSKEDE